MKCRNCSQELGEKVKVCPICRTEQIPRVSSIGERINYEANEDLRKVIEENKIEELYPYTPRSRVTAGLLQIFLGGFGIGRFYLGYNGIALGQLFTCPIFLMGTIWGVVDGILILCGQVPYDANGVPLQ